MSLGVGFEFQKPDPDPVFLSACCLWVRMENSQLLLHCNVCHRVLSRDDNGLTL